MKIQIKITNLEISIDTDEPTPTPTPAIVETIAKALQATVSPLPVIAEQPKARKARTVEAAQTQSNAATPEPIAEKSPNTAECTTVVVPAQTNAHDAGTPNKPQRMDFHEFDSLVRAEMARLAPEPGVMPSSTVWDAGRNAVLPTWNTVLARYGCLSTKSLAEKLNLRQARPKPEAA